MEIGENGPFFQVYRFLSWIYIRYSRQLRPDALFFSFMLRTFALIVYAHPYCARNSCRNAMLRYARARAQRKKSIHMKGW